MNSVEVLQQIGSEHKRTEREGFTGSVGECDPAQELISKSRPAHWVIRTEKTVRAVAPMFVVTEKCEVHQKPFTYAV